MVSGCRAMTELSSLVASETSSSLGLPSSSLSSPSSLFFPFGLEEDSLPWLVAMTVEYDDVVWHYGPDCLIVFCAFEGILVPRSGCP